jgi:hypothetical protein
LPIGDFPLAFGLNACIGRLESSRDYQSLDVVIGLNWGFLDALLLCEDTKVQRADAWAGVGTGLSTLKSDQISENVNVLLDPPTQNPELLVQGWRQSPSLQ